VERTRITIVAFGLGLLTVAAATPPAQAQSNRPRHGVVVPAPRIYTSPTTPLIEEGFRRLRSGSRNPDNYLGGRYNPEYITIYPPRYNNNGGGWGGGWYGYPGYGYYGGYPYGYGYPAYGNGYPYGYGYGLPGQPLPQVPLQRDVIVQREAPRDVQPEQRPRDNGDGFYLGGRAANESISDALDDIRKAWLNGDVNRLKARLKSDGKVRVYLKGEYKYSMDNREFAALVKDAMTRFDTIAFELDRPQSEEAGRAFVTGKHTYTDADKTKQEVYVSYGLQRVDGKWLIVEAGSSATPVTRHQ